MRKKIAVAIAMIATIASVVPTTTVFSEEITAEEFIPKEDDLVIPIAEGQPIAEAFAAATGITETLEVIDVPEDKFSKITFSTSTEASTGAAIDTTSNNHFSYIGELTRKDGKKIHVRIPYWFQTVFPDAKWYYSNMKGKMKVVLRIYPKVGLGGKAFDKAIKLSQDSRLWLGGWGDTRTPYEEMMLPPWLEKVFKEEAPIITTGTDPDLGDANVIIIRAWKNKKCLAQGKNPIVKTIHYANYNHYRVTTTNYVDLGGTDGNADDGGSIIIVD